MAKPILIIRSEIVPDAGKWHKQLVENFENEYHVFLVLNSFYKEITFEIYNSDKIEAIELEKLKEIIDQTKKIIKHAKD